MRVNFDNPAAFKPFYDEIIVVEGKRPSHSGATGFAPSAAARTVKGTFHACIFDGDFADPVVSGDVDSDVRTFSISVRPGDWIEGTPPQPGDNISFNRGAIQYSLKVKDVNPTFGSWTVTAREVK